MSNETISGRKTSQVIAGDSWKDLISNYTDLTGKQPLPARWTLGNFSSRFGYHSQEEVEKTIKKFEEDFYSYAGIHYPDIEHQIETTKELSEELMKKLDNAILAFKKDFKQEGQ